MGVWSRFFLQEEYFAREEAKIREEEESPGPRLNQRASGASESWAVPPAGVMFRMVLAFLFCMLFVASTIFGSVPARMAHLTATVPPYIMDVVELLFAVFWAAVGVGMLRRVRAWEVAGTVCAGLFAALAILSWLSRHDRGMFTSFLFLLSFLFLPGRSARSRRGRDLWYGVSSEASD